MADSGGIINRLRAAKERAVAAANLGFDTALTKQDTSTQGDEILENESFMTAKDLAMQFRNMCPETPNFLLAYKQRVEEIYGSAETGFIAGYALSIRATLCEMTEAKLPYLSLGGAIVHLHLLACIIALGSNAEEAMSTWEAIVALPMLGQGELRRGVTRSQLAMWDSIARAWIETGDRCMSKEKSQLESLLQQVDLAPWKMFSLTFDNHTGSQRISDLFNAWLSALTVMENLASGQPQEVQDGEVLKLFSAFHLYPDVYVFGSRNAEAHMHDALVPPRGVLTVDFGLGAKATSNEILRALSLPDL